MNANIEWLKVLDLSKEQVREQTATAFAEKFILVYKSIYEQYFSMLKEHFTNKKISELCSFISFITASQKLGKIYNL